jgi:membrane protein implicated in regulation of membrane protease activity
MIDVPVDDLVFIVCTLVGGGLLLITVLLDDVIGGLFDVLHIDFDIGGVSLVPLMLGFVSMFGVGGLFATQVLEVRGGQAAIVGTVSGLIGFSIVYLMFNLLRKSEGANPFSTSTLVGRSASVAVDIPAGRRGTVLVKAEGQTHEFSATAAVDIPAGTTVTVTGTAGTGLIVAPQAGQPPSTAGDGPADASGVGGNTGV